MDQLKELVSKIQNYNSSADFDLIKKAYEFAEIAHAGQKRKSGESFLIHPVRVAQILADYRLDTVSIIVGLLHDTIEDGGAF